MWSTWAAAYGGYGRVDGDPWGAGSHNVSTNAGGVVAGLDYRPAPGTVFGAAIAGAGGNWSLADGAGGGDTSALQLGLYGATHWGPVYLGGALSFTNDWASTSRGGFSQSLKANFDAQNYGGRIEAGYRMETAFGAFTPYAAGQAQSLHTPSFSEGSAFGASFRLRLRRNTASNERGELGFRFDAQRPIGSDMTLAFQGKVAWAHDWFSDNDLSATFLAAPISYVVSGAIPSHDLALISAGAELHLGNRISLIGQVQHRTVRRLDHLCRDNDAHLSVLKFFFFFFDVLSGRRMLDVLAILQDLDLLQSDEPARHHGVEDRQNALMLSSVSTISITSGKFSRTSRIFMLCSLVEWPKPMGPRRTVAPEDEPRGP